MKRGRPKTQMEKMTTIRVREGQRMLLEAIRDLEGGANHEVLTRILKHYLNHHKGLKEKVKKAIRIGPVKKSE